MALGDAYKTGRNFIAGVITNIVGASVVWVKGPLAWGLKQAIEWFLNVTARPLYDLLERKKVEIPIKQDIDKKIEAVKTAKTEAEINKAIDEMP
jgi:hypothetical protein